MTIPEITKLLEEHKFREAEAALKELERADHQNTSVAYLLGTLYDDYNNPERSREKARSHFSAAATGNPPVEAAFIPLGRLENNKNHSIRIMEKGLSLFPKSQSLLVQLFRYNSLENREVIFLRAQAQGVVSDNLRAEMVSAFVVLKQVEKALKLVNEIQEPSLQEGRELITAICLLESKQFEKSAEIFRKIVNNDINRKFEYVPHFGLIGCLLEKQPQSAVEVFSEIPAEMSWNSYADEMTYWPFSFDSSSFILRIIGSIEKLPCFKHVLAKLRGLRGLVVDSDPDLFLEPRNRSTMVSLMPLSRGCTKTSNTRQSRNWQRSSTIAT